MIKKSYLICLLTFLFFQTASTYAQNSFGVEFGHNFENYSGRPYLFDSITVIPNVGSDPGEAFGGIFYNYSISPRITLHSKLNYGERFYQFKVFNAEKECLFCPQKLKLLSIKSLALEFFPQYTLVKGKNWNLNFFGGFSTTFNFYSGEGDVLFENEPGVTDTFNALDSVVRPVTLGLGYGASIEVWRVIFWAKVNTPVQLTKQIEIYDQEYDFENSWGFVSFSLGYKFYSFRFKKKAGELR